MFKTLVIYEKDGEYSSHLSEYIKSKTRGLFQIKLFTREEALKEFLREETADILLWGEETEEVDGSINNYKCLVILIQTPDAVLPWGFTAIYKYQPGEAILRAIKELLPKEDSEIKNMVAGKDIITVFSLNNAHFSREYSLALWREKASSSRTLFFLLEPFPGLMEFEAKENESGLSEFIYYLKQNPKSLNKKLNKLIQIKGDLHYIKGVAFGTDLYEITAEDMENWLQIAHQSEYDTVIFDTGVFSPAVIKLLKESNKIYLSAEEGRYGEEQVNNFLTQLKWAGYEELLSRITPVKIGKESACLGWEAEPC